MIREVLIKNKISVELGIVFLMLGLILTKQVTFAYIIVSLLSFIVLLEVVRMVTSYVLGEEPIMKLRFIIDGFIVFFLRDIVLIFSEPKYELSEKEDKLIVAIFIIFALFVFRAMSLAFSPNDKNCDVCLSKSACNLKSKT